MRRKAFFLLVVAAGMLAGRAEVRAQVPAGNQATLMLRILAYDRNLAKRAGKTVTIALVYKPGNPESESTAEALASALKEQGEKFLVAGLPLRVVSIKYAGGPQLQASTAAISASAVYVCPGLLDEVGFISKATHQNSMLSFAGNETYVKNGLGVGLILRSAKAVILVNLPAAQAEGAQLDAALLRVAEVIR